MPLRTIRDQAAAAITAALKSHFDFDADVHLEVPPNRALGDFAWPGALPLARELRQAPRKIAEAVSEHAAWPTEVARIEIAGPGFLNLYLERGVILEHLVRNQAGETATTAQKVIVEHTNINPNKAAHIGHLRNAVLGDTLVRCLRALGRPVEVQNYIDDTGVQVADVVVGLLFLPIDELATALDKPCPDRAHALSLVPDRMPREGIPTAATDDFDDLCWTIYPRVTSRATDDSDFASKRGEVLHMVESGFADLSLSDAVEQLGREATAEESYSGPAVARLAAAVAEGNVRCHLATMARLGVAYDVLPHESDILQLGFWQRAFELLKAAGAIRLETNGKNAGCWVMSLASSAEFADMDDPDKILVRSNHTVTYTGKDIAYQLWKLGLLHDPAGQRCDFGYSSFANWHQASPAEPVNYGGDGGHILARTTNNADERIEHGNYGNGTPVYNVIDVRQSYPQKVVKEAVRTLGHTEAADQSIHFAYEMVALTPKAVGVIEERTGADFGLGEEEMQKPFIEMSGRRGIGVKADEFLDVLVSAAEESILGRIGDGPQPDDLHSRARAIAVGSLRYLMTRQSRNRVLAFDFDDALAFEGDTGPYLQYSAVRAAKIFERLAQRRGEGRFTAAELESIEGMEITDDLWEILLECARRQDVIAQAVANLEFSLLAQHVHNLAQIFHRLYSSHPVIPEDDQRLRALRRAVFTVFLDEIRSLLTDLLGIPVPNEM